MEVTLLLKRGQYNLIFVLLYNIYKKERNE